MINNKGFVFLETIIITVVLTTTLIFLYSNFSKNINDEKQRLYYDDIAYIYKTAYIRNAVKNTVDDTIFNAAINDKKTNNKNSLENNFVYLFSSESKFCTKYKDNDSSNMDCAAVDYKSIYDDNTYINNVYLLYNFKTLIYLRTEDLPNIKKCINKGKDYFEENQIKNKCENFLSFTESYSGINLKEYMLTINGTDANKNSIMIGIFYEKKDGSSYSSTSYKNCINEKIINGTDFTFYETNKEKVEAYYNQDEISYSMGCENAYYISWVYYGE